MAHLTWARNEAGEWASGDYRIVRKSGYCDVFYSGDKINEVRTSLKDCKQIAQRHADEVEWAMAQADKGIEEANDQAEAILNEIAELERTDSTPDYCEDPRDGSGFHDENPQTEPEPVPMPAVERSTTAIKTHEQVRETLGLIVDQFGADIPPLELPGILIRHGLSTDDVTPGLLRQIGRERQERLRQGFREFNEKAKEKGSPQRILVRGDVEFDPDLNPELPGPARDRQEQKERIKAEQRKRFEELKARKENGLDHPADTAKLTQVDDPIQPSPEEEGVMNVKDKAARNLLVAMGYAEAADKKKWPRERLQKELNDPKALMEDAREVSGKELELLNTICKALNSGGKVKVISGTPNPSGKPKAKPEKGKPSKPRKIKDQPNGEAGPSNKEIVYKAWIASKKKADPADLYKKVEGNVKDTTVRSWVSAWGRGENLPACAK